MLVRGRVEHDVWPESTEYVFQPFFVGHIAHDRSDEMLKPEFNESVVQGIEVGLRPLEQHELGRFNPANLPAELRSDRTGGAGHEDPLSAHENSDRGEIEPYRIPTQQILDGEGPYVTDGDAAADQVVQVG